MERAGPTVAAPRSELDDLKPLLEGASSELITVWANRPGTTPADIDARVRAELTATPARREGRRGDELGSALADALRIGEAAVVVASDRVLLAEPLPEPVRQEATFSESLPALVPLIDKRQRDLPSIVVHLDRRGADIAWNAGGKAGSESVAGDPHFITKVHAGGWSHASYQRAVEVNWEQTATQAAAVLERVAVAIGARTVLLAADVRMGELLRRHLPPAIEAIVREVPGARSADGSDEHRQAEIERWLRSVAAEDTAAVLREFDGLRERPEPLAVSGAEATFAALRNAQVDTLLVSDAVRSEPIAYYDAEDPMCLGLAEADMASARTPRLARRCDVAVRAALLTGAGVRVVPRRAGDGLGALLRWPNAQP